MGIESRKSNTFHHDRFYGINSGFSERFVHSLKDGFFIDCNLMRPCGIFHPDRERFVAIEFWKSMLKRIGVNQPRRKFAIFFAYKRSFNLAFDAEARRGPGDDFLKRSKHNFLGETKVSPAYARLPSPSGRAGFGLAPPSFGRLRAGTHETRPSATARDELMQRALLNFIINFQRFSSHLFP